MNEASEATFMTPDFLIIPYRVIEEDKLRPTDLQIYGVIYWYEHLKEGRCIASNLTISRAARCSVRAVQAGLARLEKYGFIQSIFVDKQKSMRMEIRTLVRYDRVKPIDKPIIEERAELTYPEEKTPGETAREFFSDGKSNIRQEIHKQICDTNPGANPEMIKAEMKKFIVYWTEPNKSGTKQRWQLQQTFDVKRRIYQWLSRAGSNQKVGGRAGAGTVI